MFPVKYMRALIFTPILIYVSRIVYRLGTLILCHTKKSSTFPVRTFYIGVSHSMNYVTYRTGIGGGFAILTLFTNDEIDVTLPQIHLRGILAFGSQPQQTL